MVSISRNWSLQRMIKKILAILLIVFICLTFSGCGPEFIKQEPLPELKFEKTPSYKVDLSSIIKPDKPIHIWVDENFKQVAAKDAKYLLLTNEEYAKYVAQLKIKKTYEEIINQQEILINQYINVINSLKEYVELERLKADEYRKMWVDSENAYRYERHLHSIDNALSRGAFGILTIGSLALAIIFAL